MFREFSHCVGNGKRVLPSSHSGFSRETSPTECPRSHHRPPPHHANHRGPPQQCSSTDLTVEKMGTTERQVPRHISYTRAPPDPKPQAKSASFPSYPWPSRCWDISKGAKKQFSNPHWLPTNRTKQGEHIGVRVILKGGCISTLLDKALDPCCESMESTRVSSRECTRKHLPVKALERRKLK